MCDNFEESFRDFFLKLTVLNYKVSMKIELNDEWQNVKKAMDIIIPIFNRVTTEKTLSLENAINNTINVKDIKDIKDTKDTNYENDEYLFVNTNNTTHTITPKVIDNEPDEPDIEGDKLVEELNAKSLVKLEEYRKNNIFLVEEEDSTEVSSENDDNDDNDGNDDNKNSNESNNSDNGNNDGSEGNEEVDETDEYNTYAGFESDDSFSLEIDYDKFNQTLCDYV